MRRILEEIARQQWAGSPAFDRLKFLATKRLEAV
jgi:hypothetical protein